MSSTSLLDWLTAIGTVGAVLAATVAIIASQRAIRAERRHQRLRERYRDALELLTAFESLRAATPTAWDTADEGPTRPGPQDLSAAAARFLALLRASEEPLPINRGMQKHLPYGADNDEEAWHLRQARLEGDPETETQELMAQRAEILDTIESLRRQLQQDTN